MTTNPIIRAGYSKKTASEQVYDLLRKPQIEKDGSLPGFRALDKTSKEEEIPGFFGCFKKGGRWEKGRARGRPETFASSNPS